MPCGPGVRLSSSRFEDVINEVLQHGLLVRCQSLAHGVEVLLRRTPHSSYAMVYGPACEPWTPLRRSGACMRVSEVDEMRVVAMDSSRNVKCSASLEMSTPFDLQYATA